MLVAQRVAEVDVPARADLYDVGTLAQLIAFDGKRAAVEGRRRVRITGVRERDGMLVATTTPIDASDPKFDVGVVKRLLAAQLPPAEARALMLPHLVALPPAVQQQVLETDDVAAWVRALDA